MGQDGLPPGQRETTMRGLDRYTKTIRIPVRLSNGGIQLLDGQPLPKIRDKAFGELLLNEDAVEDEKFIKEYQTEATVHVLNAEQSVFFTVHAHQMPSESWKEAKQKGCFVEGPEGPVVEVQLQEELHLRLRGTKPPVLCGCKCKVPCLENTEAVSLNHAYTLISAYFETKRISHSGNVFQLGWWYDEQQKRWVQLDDLRTARQVEYETA